MHPKGAYLGLLRLELFLGAETMVAEEKFKVGLHNYYLSALQKNCRINKSNDQDNLLKLVGIETNPYGKHQTDSFDPAYRKMWPYCKEQLEFQINYFQNKKKMQSTLRVNQSLMNLACVSSLNTSICGKQEVHQLIRRKLSGNNHLDKRKKSSFETDQVAVRYIPIVKTCQETSVSANVSRQNSKENLHDEKRNSMSTRRFQRITESSYENLKTAECNIPKEICKTKACIDERTQMAETIKHLKRKNERLEEEKLKLQAQVKQHQERTRNTQEQLKLKCQKNEQLSAIITKKEVACNKMHETINEKYRQINKLQDIVNKLQKQIMSSSNPQSFTPLSLQSSRIINQLSSQLKYKEIENHLLKKEKFDAFALEEQLKVLTKENSLLKDRLSYYIRMNGKYAHDDSCSSESISLELSQTSPLRKSSRDHFSNHFLKASQP